MGRFARGGKSRNTAPEATSRPGGAGGRTWSGLRVICYVAVGLILKPPGQTTLGSGTILALDLGSGGLARQCLARRTGLSSGPGERRQRAARFRQQQKQTNMRTNLREQSQGTTGYLVKI